MFWEAEKECPLDANFKIYQENIALRFVKPASGVSPKAGYWRSPVAPLSPLTAVRLACLVAQPPTTPSPVAYGKSN